MTQDGPVSTTRVAQYLVEQAALWERQVEVVKVQLITDDLYAIELRAKGENEAERFLMRLGEAPELQE